MITQLKFVGIPATDQDRALKFYTEKLGFEVSMDQVFDEKQRWIELGIAGGDTRIVLFQFGDNLKPGGSLNLSFWSDDVESTAAALKAKGVEFAMEPKRMHYGTISAFKDPDGNVLGLLQDPQ